MRQALGSIYLVLAVIFTFFTLKGIMGIASYLILEAPQNDESYNAGFLIGYLGTFSVILLITVLLYWQAVKKLKTTDKTENSRIDQNL